MMRETQQRDAIRETLAIAGRPLAVDELLQLARNKVTGLGIATVYRNLKILQSEGEITQVDLPGQAARWEIAGGHHHHFLCRTCDRLFEVYDCPEDISHILPEGYSLEKHDILLQGLCAACARKNKPGTRSRAHTAR
jgi:Fur family ferric uptake transcriptional regulator